MSEAVSGRVHARILVLDTIGDLASLYRLASVAFVGGSLLPHGGHNPLEPAQFGVPAIMGPHFENFRDIVAHLQEENGIVVLTGTEPAELGQALAGLLADTPRAHELGCRGQAVCEQQKGATARTVAALRPLLKLSPPHPVHASMISGLPIMPDPAIVPDAFPEIPSERSRTADEKAALP